MVKNQYHPHTELFKVLMHPTRLAILEILRDGEQCVCHMEAILGLRQAHISQHLMILREAGLVSDRRDGWNIFYRVVRPAIYDVLDATRGYLGMTDPPPLNLNDKQEVCCPCPKCSTRKEGNK